MNAPMIPETDLKKFDLHESNLRHLNDRTIVVQKWNWNYSLALDFQRHIVKILQEYTQLRVLICCSHPQVLTNGRGLQRPRKGETLDLVAFDPSTQKILPYPFFQIERGGGLTFHHPGQFIFYPIVRLNPKTLSLSRMINDIFDLSIEVLEGWGLTGLDHENKLLGLWLGNRKIASMGIAIERLTTFHGMALNLFSDPEMIAAMKSLNPCGLNAETYTAVSDLIPMPENAHDIFAAEFLKKVEHVWK